MYHYGDIRLLSKNPILPHAYHVINTLICRHPYTYAYIHTHTYIHLHVRMHNALLSVTVCPVSLPLGYNSFGSPDFFDFFFSDFFHMHTPTHRVNNGTCPILWRTMDDLISINILLKYKVR